MLSLSPATRVFVAIQPIDMRRSFNGLYADVQTVFGQDPLTGHLFLFTNRRRNRVKVLYWDGVRPVGLREAPGKGSLRLADGRGAQRLPASGGAPDAAARAGRQGAPQMVPDLRILVIFHWTPDLLPAHYLRMSEELVVQGRRITAGRSGADPRAGPDSPRSGAGVGCPRR